MLEQPMFDLQGFGDHLLAGTVMTLKVAAGGLVLGLLLLMI